MSTIKQWQRTLESRKRIHSCTSPSYSEKSSTGCVPQRGEHLSIARSGSVDTLAILDASPDSRLLGIDRDPEALVLARERLSIFEDRVQLINANFEDFGSALARADIKEVRGVLADLGVSSLQLEQTERGF